MSNERNNIIENHRQLIVQIRTIELQIEEKLRVEDPSWAKLEAERSALHKQIEPLIEQYWQWVPEVAVSVCPICRRELKRRFDPVDLTGFWWMERTRRNAAEPTACEHFVLMMGAVNFNGLKPRGGLFDAYPGPDAPFVVGRILDMEGMVAVVAEIKLQCGYSAYPICYFAKTPPKERSLTQSWLEREYYFNVDGRSGWDITEEEFDYQLLPWVKKKKLRWVVNGQLNSESWLAPACPYLKVDGKHKSQRIVGEELVYRE